MRPYPGGRPGQAIECIDRGVRLSHRDIFCDEYQLYYEFAHFQAGRYAAAASSALLAIQQRPDHPTTDIDTDHGDHTVKLSSHGVLLPFSASCQLTC